jgi:hypothetical protein
MSLSLEAEQRFHAKIDSATTHKQQSLPTTNSQAIGGKMIEVLIRFFDDGKPSLGFAPLRKIFRLVSALP